MRTTLNIDDEALNAALQLFPGRTKTEIVNLALRDLSRRQKVKKLLTFRGKVRWEGDIDQLRGRT